MKVNYLGIIGGVLVFISLVLPWWIANVSASFQGSTVSSVKTSVYLIQTSATAIQGPVTFSQTVPVDLWFGWLALALVVIGGWLGLAGSMTIHGRRILLALSGILVVSSLIFFAAGLQSQISTRSFGIGWPTTLNLFSSGSFSIGVYSAQYVTYLSSGFWLAMIGGIMIFGALAIKLDKSILPAPQSATSV